MAGRSCMSGKPKEVRSLLTASIPSPAGNDGNPMRIDGYDTPPHRIVKRAVTDRLGLLKACDIDINQLYVEGSRAENGGPIKRRRTFTERRKHGCILMADVLVKWGRNRYNICFVQCTDNKFAIS